jgi:hypothetical protein
MNKRLSISKDDVQRRSKKLHTRWKRVAIGLAMLASLVLIGNVIAFVGDQFSIRKSESIVANNKKDAEQVLIKWNETLTGCSIGAKADTTFTSDDEPYVSVLIRYPKNLIENWSNGKDSRALDCFSEIIFGVKLSERVDFQKDIPQADKTLFLDEKLMIHDPDGGKSKGLWGAVSDNSFSSSFSSNEIIVQFFRNSPFN